MAMYFVFSMNVYDTILICKNLIILVPKEKELVFKEAGANLYSVTAYYTSRLIA